MGVAETAELAVVLKLRDEMSGSLSRASGELDKLDRKVASAGTSTSGLTGAFRNVEGAAKDVGGALAHAKSQIGGLLTGPLGMLGLAGGLAGFAGFLGSSIRDAREFADTVDKLNTVTGLSIEKSSELASALSYFGISGDTAQRVVGMMAKNYGNLTVNQDTAIAFQKEFGLALLDSNGNLKDANQMLLDTADYFTNDSIPATTKAAALAKLYGRNWMDLVEVFEQGKDKISDVEAEARRLGLTITSDNAQAFLKARDASRQFDTALSGLKVQIGLGLMPFLTDMTSTLAEFIANHRDEIVKFFKDGAKTAADLGRAIRDDVLPVFAKINDAWNAIPDDMKSWLIGGFVASKTSKFLFDVGPIDALKGLTKGGKFVFDLLGGKGSPTNPMWTKEVGGVPGLGGGGGSGLTSALPFGLTATGLGMLAAGAVVIAGSLLATQKLLIQPGLDRQAESNISGTQNLIANGSASEIASAINGLKDVPNQLNPLQRVLYDLNANGVKVHTEGLIDALQERLKQLAFQNYREGERQDLNLQNTIKTTNVVNVTVEAAVTPYSYQTTETAVSTYGRGYTVW